MTVHGWTRAIFRTTAVATLTAGCLLASAPASEAQSRYACSGLDGMGEPMLEGEGGVFFRLQTDVLNDTRIAPRVVEEIADLAEAFEARGTRLVVVPLPTKGLVMPEALGSHARTVGFDHGLAAALYDDMLARFQLGNVATIDAIAALNSVERPMFETDPRLTNDGIQAVAAAVEGVLGSRDGAQAFSAAASGTVEVPSVRHQQLQSRCTLMVPPVVTPGVDTAALATSFGDADVILVGSGQMAGAGLATEGMFAAALNRSVRHVVAEGAALDALASIVADPDFERAPPEAVVWAFPVTDDLAAFGFRPFREIAGMARGACEPLSAAAVAGSTSSSSFDMPSVNREVGVGVLIDLGAVPVSQMTFTVERDDVALRSRTILRHGEVKTTRFLMPLDALGAGATDTIRLEVPDVLGPAPAISLCEV